MKYSISLIALSMIAGTAGISQAAPRSEIAAAAVENTRTAEVLRLVVSPKLEQFEEKIICAEGMIRIRLDGISNRGREIQELSVPAGGPIRRARIIEKNPSNTVVQLFPRRNPQGTCSRTTVTAVGGEIIVSTAYTAAEASHLFPRKTEKSPPSTPPVAAAAILPARQAAPEAAAARTAEESEKAAAGEDTGLVFKNDKPKTEGGSGIGFAESPISAPKAAFGFGFAAALAGIALYLKRKKKFSVGRLDQIEILSTQRLGVRQQLMLVSVQDVKFLLAVSDKNVSSLGVVPEEVSATRALPAPKEGPTMSVESTLESLIGEASRRAAAKQAMPSMPEPKERFTGFDSELRRALDHTQLGSDRSVEKTPASRFDSASNAAGLVALARMRANLKKSTGKSQVFEA